MHEQVRRKAEDHRAKHERSIVRWAIILSVLGVPRTGSSRSDTLYVTESRETRGRPELASRRGCGPLVGTRFDRPGGPSPRGRYKIENSPKADLRFDPLRNTDHSGAGARGGFSPCAWNKMEQIGTREKDTTRSLEALARSFVLSRAGISTTRVPKGEHVTKCLKMSRQKRILFEFREIGLWVDPSGACTNLHRFAPCTYGS